MAKFKANKNKSAFTKLFSFFTTKDFHPRMSFNRIDFSNTSTHELIFQQKALDISGKMEIIREFIRKALVAA